MQLKILKNPKKHIFTSYSWRVMYAYIYIYIYFNFASYNKCIAENVMESQNIIMHK